MIKKIKAMFTDMSFSGVIGWSITWVVLMTWILALIPPPSVSLIFPVIITWLGATIGGCLFLFSRRKKDPRKGYY